MTKELKSKQPLIVVANKFGLSGPGLLKFLRKNRLSHLNFYSHSNRHKINAKIIKFHESRFPIVKIMKITSLSRSKILKVIRDYRKKMELTLSQFISIITVKFGKHISSLEIILRLEKKWAFIGQ
jgi:hypothetical protein